MPVIKNSKIHLVCSRCGREESVSHEDVKTHNGITEYANSSMVETSSGLICLGCCLEEINSERQK